MQQKLRIKKNNNGRAVPEAGRGAALVSHEMAALEDLGPLTRRAICEGAMPVLAASIVSQVIEANDKIHAFNEQRVAAGLPQRAYIDPKHPDLDQRFALGVVENNIKIILADESLGDRSFDWAMMAAKPLVAKPTAKTLRERRKTESRRFRGW